MQSKLYHEVRDPSGLSFLQAYDPESLRVPFDICGYWPERESLLTMAAEAARTCGDAAVKDRPVDHESFTLLTFALLDEERRQGDSTLAELMLTALTVPEPSVFETVLTLSRLKRRLPPAVWAVWWLWYLDHRDAENPFATAQELEESVESVELPHAEVQVPPDFQYVFEEAVAKGNTPIPLSSSPKVDDVGVYLGCGMGVAWAVHEESTDAWYSCYYNPTAGDLCCKYELLNWPYVSVTDAYYILESYHHWTDSTWWWSAADRPWCPCEYCQVDEDPDAFLESMAGASDWESWEWEEFEGVVY